MANRNFRSQFSYGYAGQPVVIRAKITIGASGAPTISTGTGMGITSITRNSAGDYSILLANPYYELLGVHQMFNAGSSAPAAPIVSIEGNTVSTASAPTLRLWNRNGSSQR
jgi:hypothetical protein